MKVVPVWTCTQLTGNIHGIAIYWSSALIPDDHKCNVEATYWCEIGRYLRCTVCYRLVMTSEQMDKINPKLVEQARKSESCGCFKTGEKT